MAGLKGITTTPSTTTHVGDATQPTTPSVSTSPLAGIGGAAAAPATPAPRIQTARVPESMAADISDGGGDEE